MGGGSSKDIQKLEEKIRDGTIDIKELSKKLERKDKEMAELVKSLESNLQLLGRVVSKVMIKFADNPDNECLRELTREIGIEMSDMRTIQ
ncbi:unnamed protein product [Oikopleura dioica]|uniref:Uncharacterized protein n=1 Tax=Oikopleura dioica TaxID=34765 RepID=E4XL59_OIKDI|nr:unnamed protein product [Oikopleura dioica]